MSVKFAPVSQIKVMLGIQTDGPAQKKLVNSCYRRMGKYVPGRDSSRLNKNAKLTNHSIIYDSPYAHYQYIGKLYVMANGKGAYFSDDYGFWSEPGKAKTPTNIDLNHPSGGGPYWAEEMLSAEYTDLIKEMEEYIRRK